MVETLKPNPFLPEIGKEEYEEICEHSWKQVNPNTFMDSESWPILKNIILYHPNPIVRHEASYIAGDLNIYDLVPVLIDAVKYDLSIVGKHEAVEALGFIKGPAAKQAHDFIKSLLEDKNQKLFEHKLIYHEDVIKTAEEAFKLLEKEIEG